MLVEKNKDRKGLSASEYFSNADITDLSDEELTELNDEKDMMIWLKKYNYYWGGYFFWVDPFLK